MARIREDRSFVLLLPENVVLDLAGIFLQSVSFMKQMKTGSGCEPVATAKEISLPAGDLGKSAPRSQVTGARSTGSLQDGRIR